MRKEEASVVDQDLLKKIQDTESERGDSKPGGSMVTSPILEDGTMKSEESKSNSIEIPTTATNLQGKNSELLT